MWQTLADSTPIVVRHISCCSRLCRGLNTQALDEAMTATGDNRYSTRRMALLHMQAAMQPVFLLEDWNLLLW
jgi:hypothetical protein